MKNFTTNPNFFGKCTIVLIALVFLLTMTTYTLSDLLYHRSYEDESVQKDLTNTFESYTGAPSNETNGFSLVNMEQERSVEHPVSKRFDSERKLGDAERSVRQTSDNSEAANARNITTTSTKVAIKCPPTGCYEEQQPVVLHEENLPLMGYRQTAQGPPKLDEQPYYAHEDDYGDGETNDDYDYYKREPQPYYSDSREQYDDIAGAAEPFEYGQQTSPQADQAGVGRAATVQQQHAQDSYYRRQQYPTPTPMANRYSEANMGERRKFQTQRWRTGNRDSYESYLDGLHDNDYDSLPNENLPPHKQQQSKYSSQDFQTYPSQSQRLRPRLRPRPRPQQPTTLAPPTESENNEPTLLSVVKHLRTMWDLYQAFSGAWNGLVEHRQKQEELRQQELQKQKQQLPSRINSKRPPKFENQQSNRNKTATKNNTRTTTTTPTSIAAVSNTSLATTSELPPAKVEPRLGNKGDAAGLGSTSALREKRAASDSAAETTDVAEGRYIKGDPLKGYYDFVITEGSYKFWAVFQVGTAILIIYSTFAAIYYSKVNPLVSDYDYVDYLGGARSLSGGDLDFVDDAATDGDETKQHRRGNWYDWVPRAGHSLKFILEAIDKLPVDHAAAATEKKDTKPVTEWAQDMETDAVEDEA